MILPTKEECLRILKESNVPDNIIAHCKAVGDFAMTVADKLKSRGINVNPNIIHKLFPLISLLLRGIFLAIIAAIPKSKIVSMRTAVRTSPRIREPLCSCEANTPVNKSGKVVTSEIITKPTKKWGNWVCPA